MARPPRTDIGGYAYHVLNRANARSQIFEKEADYEAFEGVLEEAQRQSGMPILAYCVMPNHWHLVLYPPRDGMLSSFVRWLTLTHTQRWHAAHETTGSGHLYQGRYKSLLVQTDVHLIAVLRYVERNPVRAKLVRRAEDWKWSSLWRHMYGTTSSRSLLSSWPVPAEEDYLALVNAVESEEELATVRRAVQHGSPYGHPTWMEHVTTRFALASTIRPAGRPRRPHYGM